jgi:REP element-mobilizing transposase RayT
MPRQSRLDIPGVLQHVIVRGIERSDIFRDDDDRRNFVTRLSSLLVETKTDCFAWALIPNHFHLLLRCNRDELSRFMRRLLTGYAVTFNRRHHRTGHLFQNRYKSIVCEEDTYLLELVRYLHLNPLRAELVKDLEALDRYPWCGHAVLLGNMALSGQAVDEVLALFAKQTKAARDSYRRFLADGINLGSRPELVGGGLRCSQVLDDDGSAAMDFDDRVLGGSNFLESLRGKTHLLGQKSQGMDLDNLQNRIADLFGLQPEDLCRRGRQNEYSEARALFCYLAVRSLLHTGVKVGVKLNMGVSSVSRAVRRGEDLMASRPELKKWWDGQLKQ